MNRIDRTFTDLKRKRKKAFIAFITAGDPSLKVTEQLVYALEGAGVDIIELGVPFSDPLADGPTIQAASERALKHHVNLNQILHLVARLRRKTQIPLALMTYYNPVFHFGEKRFVKNARRAGVDGVIIPDLPLEEGRNLIQLSRKENLATVFFLSPTTTKARMRKIIQASSGFIYFVSLTGVTGARKSLPADLAKSLKLAKRMSKKPICVGFGISTPQQVKSLARLADGVIVGSAIINEIKRSRGSAKKVQSFVRRLTVQCHSECL